MLEKELEVYRLNKANLQLKNANGGFVVIKGEEILGVWETRLDALKIGIEKYGNVSFLIKNIDENNEVFNFSHNIQFS